MKPSVVDANIRNLIVDGFADRLDGIHHDMVVGGTDATIGIAHMVELLDDPAAFRQDLDLESVPLGAWYVETLSPDCRPYSRMGKRAGALHVSYVNFLISMFHIKHALRKPDLVFLEEDPSFPVDEAISILKGIYRPELFNFGPQHLGHGISRTRCQLVFYLEATTIPLGSGSLFAQQFFRKRVMEGHSYFAAPEADVKQWLEKRKLKKEMVGDGVTDEDLFPGGGQVRIDRYREQYQMLRGGTGPWFIDPMQNASARNRASEHIFTLTCRTTDIVALGPPHRCTIPGELFLMQGVPVFGQDITHGAIMPCPFEWQNLTQLDIAGLTGNGQHVAAIGSLALFVFSHVVRREVPDPWKGVISHRQCHREGGFDEDGSAPGHDTCAFDVEGLACLLAIQSETQGRPADDLPVVEPSSSGFLLRIQSQEGFMFVFSLQDLQDTPAQIINPIHKQVASERRSEP